MANTHPSHALTDLQKTKLFNEASKLSQYLSYNQIHQALNSPQFSDDEFIFTLIQQAQKNRDSFSQKVKRWFSKYKFYFRLTGILYLIILLVTIASFCIGIAFSAAPLTLLISLFATPLIALKTVSTLFATSIASTIFGLACTALEFAFIFTGVWLKNKITNFFTKKTPEDIQRTKEEKEFNKKLKETKIPSFERNLQPLHAHLFKIAISVKTSHFFNQYGLNLFLANIGHKNTTFSFNYYFNQPLNQSEERILLDAFPWTNINTLSFENQHNISNACILSLAKHEQLRKIAFKDNATFDNGSIQEIAKLKHLKEFSHNRLPYDKETYKALLSNNSTFDKISINFDLANPHASINDITVFLSANKNIKSFEILKHVSNVQLDDQLASSFIKTLQLHNVYIQELKISSNLSQGDKDILSNFLKRNQLLAEKREKAKTLLHDIQQNRIHLNSEQLSCIVDSVANELTQTTHESLNYAISIEVENYKEEMEALADDLHEAAGAWIQEKTGRQIGQTPAEKLPQLNLEFAAKQFFAVTAASRRQFSNARVSGFEHAYYGRLNLTSETKNLNIFFDAFAKACLNKHKELILLNDADQEVIDKALVINAIENNEIPDTLLSTEERFVLLQFSFMKHAYSSLMSYEESLSLPMQVKRDKFKDTFSKSTINPVNFQNSTCQKAVNELWHTFCEAQGAIKDQNSKILFDAICEYGEKIKLSSLPRSAI